jgi:hypothetical protein
MLGISDEVGLVYSCRRKVVAASGILVIERSPRVVTPRIQGRLPLIGFLLGLDPEGGGDIVFRDELRSKSPHSYHSTGKAIPVTGHGGP